MQAIEILFLLVGLSVQFTRSADVCPPGAEPVCPNPDPEFSVFFPHEKDCEWFYHCSNGIAYCKQCPDGLHWNTELDTCDWPDDAGCGGNEKPTTAAPTTARPSPPPTTKPTKPPAPSSQAPQTTAESVVCPPGAEPVCPNPDPELSVFFPHENDCEWFYHCSNGIAYCKQCPDGLHWNTELDTCDWPDDAGCGGNEKPTTAAPTTARPSPPPTTKPTKPPAPSSQAPQTTAESVVCPPGAEPVCPNPDPEFSVFFPHENDCEWFYHCSNGIAYCKQCPDGLHWNTELDTCDWPDDAGCGGNGKSTTAAPTTARPSPPPTTKPTKPPAPSSQAPQTTAESVVCPPGAEPVCPNPDPELSVFFPHEKDCEWFYHCSNGIAYCKQCPDGLHWNTELDTCDWPDDAGCGGNEKPTTAAPTTARPSPPPTTKPTKPPAPSSQAPQTTAESVVCPPGAEPVCPNPDPELSVFFPHEKDCEWFYHCSNGIAYCKQCPDGLHWNTELDTCDWPDDAGCGGNEKPTTAAPTTARPSPPPTTKPTKPPAPSSQAPQTTAESVVCPPGAEPVCPNPDPEFSVFFPHENDCEWFYHCSNGIAYCKQCPDGLHWNTELDTCDWPDDAGCGGNGKSTTAAPTTARPSPPPTTKPTKPPAPSSQAPQTTAESVVCPPGAEPVCPNPDPELSVFFPHEKDCEWFYHCSNGIAYCKQCPDGLHWNTELDTCDWPDDAGCGGNGKSTTAAPTTARPSPPPTTKPTKPPAPSSQAPQTTAESVVCPPGAEPVCPNPDPEFSVFFPHENDCEWFYHCSNGIAYCKQCPDGLHWNTELDTCDWPDDAGCGGNEKPTTAAPTTARPSPPPTTKPTKPPAPSSQAPQTTAESVVCPPGAEPVCPNPDPEFSVFFPHEKDCEWFYHCSNGIAYCKQCPDGLHWNTELDTCDWPDDAGCGGNGKSTTAAPTTARPSPPPTTKPTKPPAPSSQAPQTTAESVVCPPGAEPVCPNPDPELSVFFPHEKDCEWFYHCSNGIAYCKQCPDGLHWNTELDTCDWPDDAGCGGNEKPTTAAPTTARPSPPPTTKPPTTSRPSRPPSTKPPPTYRPTRPPSTKPPPTYRPTRPPSTKPPPTSRPTRPPSTKPPPTSRPTDPPTAAPPTTRDPSLCPDGVTPTCPFPDPEFSVFFPHENDCRWFYHCSNGNAYCKICPAGLHWNVELDTCDYPYRAGCE